MLGGYFPESAVDNVLVARLGARDRYQLNDLEQSIKSIYRFALKDCTGIRCVPGPASLSGVVTSSVTRP